MRIKLLGRFDAKGENGDGGDVPLVATGGG